VWLHFLLRKHNAPGEGPGAHRWEGPRLVDPRQHRKPRVVAAGRGTAGLPLSSDFCTNSLEWQGSGRPAGTAGGEVYYLANLNDGTTRARFRGHPTGLRNQGVTDSGLICGVVIWLLPRLATYATNMNGAYDRT